MDELSNRCSNEYNGPDKICRHSGTWTGFEKGTGERVRVAVSCHAPGTPSSHQPCNPVNLDEAKNRPH